MKNEKITGSDLENKVKYNDIRLAHNGTTTTLKSEINRKIHSYQKKETVDCLQHDIMIINLADKNDGVEKVIENAFSNSDINWNLLSLGKQKILDEKPEILELLNP